jgi:hypothetical protein
VKIVFNATGHSNTRTFEVCSLSASSGAKKGCSQDFAFEFDLFITLVEKNQAGGVKTF